MQISLKKARSPETTEGGRSDEALGILYIIIQGRTVSIHSKKNTFLMVADHRAFFRLICIVYRYENAGTRD
jgi:hypothetical protein